MVDPYRMVLINLIAVALFLLGIFTYKIIFKKKKVNLFYLLICISILPVISIFRKGIYESGDFIFHVYHTMDFSDALRDGVLIPSWSAGLNSGFGHPVFTFIYIFPYYLMSFLHFLGFSFISSEKLVLASAFIFSGIAMWFVLKKLTNNNLASFAGSILYLFAPYHLVDIHFRVAIAESIAFVITPIIFYLILKTKEKFKLVYLVWIGLLLGILFLNHPAMFVIYSALFLLFVLFETIIKKTHKRILITYLVSLFLGMILASFGWIPRIVLTSLTGTSALVNSPISFVSPRELIFSTWKLGFLFQGPYGLLSYVIGYAGLIILILSIFILIKKRKNKNVIYIDVLFWVTISLLTIFIMIPISKPFWDTFKFLSLMQFAYRFLHVMAFSIAILTGYIVLFYQKKQTIIYIFLSLSIIYTILNWGNRGMLPHIDDAWIRNNLPNGTKQGEKMIEATPLWWNTEKDFLTVSENKLEAVQGEVEIKNLEITSTRHKYIVFAIQNSVLVENTLYFPDWKISINGKIVPIDYLNPNFHGRMVFKIPNGMNLIEASYYDIWQIKIAKRISAILFISMVIYLILYYTSRVLEIIFSKIRKKNEK